jgi:hypothetical protein
LIQTQPSTNISQWHNPWEKATKVRPHENGPLLEASAFDEMKETIMRDLTTEYVHAALINKMIFKLIHA